jgi:hypothetical protein
MVTDRREWKKIVLEIKVHNGLRCMRKRYIYQELYFEIFHWLNPCGRTVPLGSTRPLTEMSTGNISWEVKVAGALGWQPDHLHVLIFWNVWEPYPPGTLRVCSGLYSDCCTVL